MDISQLSDIQSESGVIGTLVYHPDFIAYSENLQPRHFFELDNGCIYWAIRELYNKGIENIDAYNLSSQLKSNTAVQRAIEKFNLPKVQELIQLYKMTARNTVEEYKLLVNNVISLAFKRELVTTLSRLETDCMNKNYSLEKLSNLVYGGIDDLTERFVTNEEVRTLGSEIDTLWQEIKDRRTADGTYGMPSKFPSFAPFFTYESGELVVVQAKYKEGKSVFLMNEAIHKLENGVPTLVIDTEMSSRSYVERLLANLTGIDVNRIKSGQYSEKEEKQINDAMSWLKDQPFVHIYDPYMTNEKMYAICKMLKRKIGLAFFVYDYLKSNETSTGDNYNLLGAKCDFLKNNIAGDLDIAVLAACQLNRNGEVADSMKIDRYLSVGVRWGLKTKKMIADDGIQCGNAYAKVRVNRLGEHMAEDDEEEYIDFTFDGAHMAISEAEQHERKDYF